MGLRRNALAGFVIVVSALSCTASNAADAGAHAVAAAAPSSPPVTAPGISEAQRRNFVAATIPFGRDEGDGFWPLYRDYRRDMDKLQDRRAKIVAEYTEVFRSMTGEQAKSIIADYLQIDESIVKLKRDYLKKFLKFLPQTKATRVFMIDAKFDANALAQLTAKVSVAGESTTQEATPR